MAPVSGDASVSDEMHGFELICTLKSNDLVPVHKYRSKNTGIVVFIAEVDGPVVCGNFALATESHDDDGLPHTLEHLIFLGSEKYPYKGILDLLANRCLADGTNAATDVDYTTYVMETVGSEGFLNLLPIYVEHILYPTLTDSAYLTEVHHIDGEGNDAGVVYCEQQLHATSGEWMAYKEMLKAIYPGKCGYKADTGGDIKNLRESTTNEKVRNYHKQYYRPDNLHLIIAGQVKPIDVFKALQPVEEKILSRVALEPAERPWNSAVPPLESSVEKVIRYQNQEEDNGLVLFGWRGPSSVTNKYDLMGLNILLKYLTDTSASPLQKIFVEIEDPYASDISYSLIENSESTVNLLFSNVPLDKISMVKNRLLEAFKEIEIDVQRMSTVIGRHELEILSHLEGQPHATVTYMLIGDILYGNGLNDLNERLNEINTLKKLKDEPLSHWNSLLDKYFIGAPYVCIQAIPSIEKLKEATEEEAQRLQAQRKALGPEGLKQKEQDLIKARENNERPIPDGILSAMPIPSTDCINYHAIKTFNTNSHEQHPKLNLDKLPFYTYVDHLNTNFLYMFVFMDTSAVPIENKPYIPLILESILESPIVRNGELIPYEKVVAELESDTVAISAKLGVENTSRFTCGSYSHYAVLRMQLEIGKYQKGVKWIKEILYQTKLTPDRLKIISSKIINDVAQTKREGAKMANALVTGLLYKKDSNRFAASMLRQQDLLKKVSQKLDTEDGRKEVLSIVESVRNTLTLTESMAMYMAVNVDRLSNQTPDLYAPWQESFGDLQGAKKNSLSQRQDFESITPLPQIPIKGCVTGVGFLDSSFAYQVCPGINDFNNPDIPPLLVCLQYFTQLEGPMWRRIRGPGLTYGYRIYLKPNDGMMYFTLHSCTNVLAAFQEAKNIIDEQLKELKWDKLMFQSAKCSLIFEIVHQEKSIGSAVIESVLSHFKRIPDNYNQLIVKKISSVDIEDLNRVAIKYLKPLFDPEQSKTVILCNSAKAPEVVKGFKGMGYNLELFNGLEESYLSSW